MIKYIIKRTNSRYPNTPYLFGSDGSRRMVKESGDAEAFAARHGYISQAQAIRRMDVIKSILHDEGHGATYSIESIEI